MTFYFSPQISLWKLDLNLPVQFFSLLLPIPCLTPPPTPNTTYANKPCVSSYTELFWVLQTHHALSFASPMGTLIHPSNPGPCKGYFNTSPGKFVLFLSSHDTALTYHTRAIGLTICFSLFKVRNYLRHLIS